VYAEKKLRGRTRRLRRQAELERRPNEGKKEMGGSKKDTRGGGGGVGGGGGGG